jgi:hypothetical protein
MRIASRRDASSLHPTLGFEINRNTYKNWCCDPIRGRDAFDAGVPGVSLRSDPRLIAAIPPGSNSKRVSAGELGGDAGREAFEILTGGGRELGVGSKKIPLRGILFGPPRARSRRSMMIKPRHEDLKGAKIQQDQTERTEIRHSPLFSLLSPVKKVIVLNPRFFCVQSVAHSESAAAERRVFRGSLHGPAGSRSPT